MRLDKTYTDIELLAILKEQAQLDDAIRFIYRSYYKISATYVLQNKGREQDAEDTFQEVLVSFIEIVRAQKFRGDCSVSTFLYTLTRHRWLNQLQRSGSTKGREEKFERMQEKIEFDFGHWIETVEAQKRVVQLVEQLGDACHKILMAFYYENLSMREILSLLPYENEQVVRNKKSKCLKQLKEMIKTRPDILNSLKTNYSHGQ